MSLLLKISLGAAAVVAGLVLFTVWNSRRARKKVPPDGRFVEVDGARLHYVDIGSGPPIMMIHGLGGQLRNFTFALSAELVSHHRLIIVDRPGSGYSTFAGTASRGLVAQADIMIRLLDRLGIDRPLVVGHSLGGAVALAMAAWHPGRIGGLALLAPLTQPTDKIADIFAALALKSRAARSVIAWTLSAPMGLLQARQFGEALFGPEPTPSGFETGAGAALTLRPSAFLAASADVEACRTEMAPLALRYAELTVPVGILFAKEDRILRYEDHGPPAADAIPGADLTAMKGGHMFPLTQPRLTAEWIRGRARAPAAG